MWRGGDPATFDDEVCGLFRFCEAVLFEFECLVLLLMLNALLADITLKTFSAPCKNFTTRLSAFAGSMAFSEHVVRLPASKTKPFSARRTELVELGSFSQIQNTSRVGVDPLTGGTEHQFVFQF